MVVEVEAIRFESQDGLLAADSAIRNNDIILFFAANCENRLLVVGLDEDQLSVFGRIGSERQGLEKQEAFLFALLNFGEIKELEKLTFFVFKSGGQCFCADLALEIRPDERADTLALANRALVLPHPSLEAVEMNQAQFALAIAWIDQRVLRLISAMEAHSASFFLIARLLLTF